MRQNGQRRLVPSVMLITVPVSTAITALLFLNISSLFILTCVAFFLSLICIPLTMKGGHFIVMEANPITRKLGLRRTTALTVCMFSILLFAVYFSSSSPISGFTTFLVLTVLFVGVFDFLYDLFLTVGGL